MANKLLALRGGSHQTWLKIIEKQMRGNRVFLALGPDLKAAMVAAEVISIMRMQADESLPIEKFNELYMAACRQLLPDYYEPEKENQ